MKILLFLVALANVGLFMWEYKQGAFEPAADIAETQASPDQEPILLVGELKEAHQAQASDPRPDTEASLERISAAQATPQSGFPEVGERDNNLPMDDPASPAMENPTVRPGPLAENSAGLPVDRSKAETVAAASARSDKTVLGQPASESESAQLAAATAEKSQNSHNENEPVSCYEAGPFANGNAYQLWKNELNAAKDAIKPLSRNGEVISDHLVYYPAPETMLQAEANLKMLKEKGINDFWMFSKGEDKGQISLGIFKNESRALAMKSQLLAKGIQVEVKPRYTIKPQKYARIKGNGKVLERLAFMKQTYPTIAVKQINQCE